MERKTKIIIAIAIAATLVFALVAYRYRNAIKYYSKVMFDKTKLALIGRKINKIIIHCSATRPNQQCTVQLIDKWHKERGFDCIGYHYVIYTDGSIHEGRPVNKVGAHCVGQNVNSIGICYIGGLDNSNNAKDTRTAAQKKALIELIKEIKYIYPSATVHGHNEYANKACPCFDVSKEW